MEFDFCIEYKQGQENLVADALSRGSLVECNVVSMVQLESDMLIKIKASRQSDLDVQKLIFKLQSDSKSHKHFSWVRGELRRKRRLVIGKDLELRKDILKWLHSSTCGGHSGKDATLQRVKAVVFWKGISKDVKLFILQCSTCQRCKYDSAAYPGLLQPLPIPEHVW